MSTALSHIQINQIPTDGQIGQIRSWADVWPDDWLPPSNEHVQTVLPAYANAVYKDPDYLLSDVDWKIKSLEDRVKDREYLFRLAVIVNLDYWLDRIGIQKADGYSRSNLLTTIAEKRRDAQDRLRNQINTAAQSGQFDDGCIQQSRYFLDELSRTEIGRDEGDGFLFLITVSLASLKNALGIDEKTGQTDVFSLFDPLFRYKLDALFNVTARARAYIKSKREWDSLWDPFKKNLLALIQDSSIQAYLGMDALKEMAIPLIWADSKKNLDPVVVKLEEAINRSTSPYIMRQNLDGWLRVKADQFDESYCEINSSTRKGEICQTGLMEKDGENASRSQVNQKATTPTIDVEAVALAEQVPVGVLIGALAYHHLQDKAQTQNENDAEQDKSGQIKSKFSVAIDRDEDTVMSVGSVARRLRTELIPDLPSARKKETLRTIKRAQRETPDDKAAFVEDINAILDIYRLRIQLTDGSLKRLILKKGSIQLVGDGSGNTGAFKGAKIIGLEVVPHNYIGGPKLIKKNSLDI